MFYCLDEIQKATTADEVAFVAARVLVCLVEGHPFFDGNKRTAYELAWICIEKCGYSIGRPEAGEVVSLLARVASGYPASEKSIGSWIRKRLRTGFDTSSDSPVTPDDKELADRALRENAHILRALDEYDRAKRKSKVSIRKNPRQTRRQ